MGTVVIDRQAWIGDVAASGSLIDADFLDALDGEDDATACFFAHVPPAKSDRQEWTCPRCGFRWIVAQGAKGPEWRLSQPR